MTTSDEIDLMLLAKKCIRFFKKYKLHFIVFIAIGAISGLVYEWQKKNRFL